MTLKTTIPESVNVVFMKNGATFGFGYATGEKACLPKSPLFFRALYYGCIEIDKSSEKDYQISHSELKTIIDSEKNYYRNLMLKTQGAAKWSEIIPSCYYKEVMGI